MGSIEIAIASVSNTKNHVDTVQFAMFVGNDDDDNDDDDVDETTQFANTATLDSRLIYHQYV